MPENEHPGGFNQAPQAGPDSVVGRPHLIPDRCMVGTPGERTAGSVMAETAWSIIAAGIRVAQAAGVRLRPLSASANSAPNADPEPDIPEASKMIIYLADQE